MAPIGSGPVHSDPRRPPAVRRSEARLRPSRKYSLADWTRSRLGPLAPSRVWDARRRCRSCQLVCGRRRIVTQIVTYGRIVPSGRAEASCNSWACPIRLSSSILHAVTSGSLHSLLSILCTRGSSRIGAFGEDNNLRRLASIRIGDVQAPNAEKAPVMNQPSLVVPGHNQRSRAMAAVWESCRSR